MVGLIITGIVTFIASIVATLTISGAVFKVCSLQSEEVFKVVKKGLIEREEAITKKINERFDSLGRYVIDRMDENSATKVFSLVLKNTVNGEEKLLMSWASSESEAQEKVADLLRVQGMNPDEWGVRGLTSVSSSVVVKKEEQKLGEVFEQSKEIEVYINDLKYAADHFATTKTDKAALTRIIKKLEENGARSK